MITSIEVLSVGMPVVTLPGALQRGRAMWTTSFHFLPNPPNACGQYRSGCKATRLEQIRVCAPRHEGVRRAPHAGAHGRAFSASGCPKRRGRTVDGCRHLRRHRVTKVLRGEVWPAADENRGERAYVPGATRSARSCETGSGEVRRIAGLPVQAGAARWLDDTRGTAAGGSRRRTAVHAQ